MSHHAAAAELRAIRRGFGLVVAELADLVDVDHRQVNRWESGQTPVPPGVLDALRILETRMRRRVQERARTHPAGAPLVLHRDRVELEAADPFYTDLPSALHEWEIARLREILDVDVAYSAAWVADHPSRSPYHVAPPSLDGSVPGSQSFAIDAGVPARLRELLDGRLSPGLAVGVNDAIAFAASVPLEDLLAVVGAGVELEQPWDGGPTAQDIVADARAVDVFVVPVDDAYLLEIAGYEDSGGAHHVVGALPSQRLPWLSGVDEAA